MVIKRLTFIKFLIWSLHIIKTQSNPHQLLRIYIDKRCFEVRVVYHWSYLELLELGENKNKTLVLVDTIIIFEFSIDFAA